LALGLGKTGIPLLGKDWIFLTKVGGLQSFLNWTYWTEKRFWGRKASGFGLRRVFNNGTRVNERV